ncbi:MAG: CBS domain-containing protein [Nanoarchaeota archaeon]|nr:CBS domain-containing protein [Nanoarchaeota archaeon]
MLVKEIMTKKVISVKPTDNLQDVLSIFSKYRISGMPVVDKNNCIKGMVTESDVLKTIDVCLPKIRFDSNTAFKLIVELVKTPNIENMKKHCKNVKVNDFMEKKVFIIKPNENIIKAAEIMNNKNIKRLAVVEGKKLVGIIARADIIRALAK